MENNIPSHIQDIIDSYEDDPRHTVIRVWYGPDAATKALKFFYWDTQQEEIPILTSEERQNSIFIVYTKKMRKNTYVYFRYLTLSVGEVIREFRHGMKMLALLEDI